MRALLEAGFRAAVAAADPLQILGARLPAPPRGRIFVAAAGKAAASMALAAENHFASPLDGIAITRYGHGLPTKHIRVVEAGHPVPDAAGEKAAAEILEQVKDLREDDLLLALLSGGGSSLLSLPAPGVSMAALKQLTNQLLRSGAPIQAMNTVRKHLSAIQGGRLAAASRAPVVALIISDVTGDDPTHIASGPCTPDPTTSADARAILSKYGIDFRGPFSESPKPGDKVFSRTKNVVIATAYRSLEAAAEVFRQRGIRPEIIGDTITGEAREVGREMAQRARRTKGPAALISGGECTVTLEDGQENAGGRGGRCAEFLLALGIELDGAANVWGIAADTDGIDGSEDNAGAVLAPDSVRRIPGAKDFLARHDSYGFFKECGGLLVTGPTRTNVNDYRAILVL
ncbi:MAG TPA: glycerate kinase [Burkholderiales bacterium]